MSMALYTPSKDYYAAGLLISSAGIIHLLDKHGAGGPLMSLHEIEHEFWTAASLLEFDEGCSLNMLIADELIDSESRDLIFYKALDNIGLYRGSKQLGAAERLAKLVPGGWEQANGSLCAELIITPKHFYGTPRSRSMLVQVEIGLRTRLSDLALRT